jgi:two-component system sensor histidine kinase YesM
LGVTNYITQDIIKNQAEEKANESLNVIDLFISNMSSNMMYFLNSIFSDTEMESQLKEVWYGLNDTGVIDVLKYRQIINRLQNMSVSGENTYITIMMPDGFSFTNYPANDSNSTSLLHLDWLTEIRDKPVNQTYWAGIQPNYVKPETGNTPSLLTVVRNFKVSSKLPPGQVLVSRSVKQISPILEKYDQSRDIFLMDVNGVLVSHRDESQIGKTFPYLDLLSEGKAADIITINHIKYLANKHDLRFADWKIVSLTPFKQAAAKFSYLYRINFIVQCAFMVMFSVFLFYLIRRFTRPITKLDRVAANVDSGNLLVRSHIRGDDEIGRLGQSFDNMLDHIQDMILQITMEQQLKHKAEIDLLQAQINPHFLFNILNSMRIRIELRGDLEGAELISSLSNLLRMTINRNNEFVSLHEEVQTVQHYIKLMNFRHKEGIELIVNLETETLLEQLPRFTLQPIIENAYIHGLKQKNGLIVIDSRKSEAGYIITIEDDGIGMTTEQLSAITDVLYNRSEIKPRDTNKHHSKVSGIGIKNVYDRLKIMCGQGFEMSVHSEYGNGTTITLVIPNA